MQNDDSTSILKSEILVFLPGGIHDKWLDLAARKLRKTAYLWVWLWTQQGTPFSVLNENTYLSNTHYYKYTTGEIFCQSTLIFVNAVYTCLGWTCCFFARWICIIFLFCYQNFNAGYTNFVSLMVRPPWNCCLLVWNWSKEIPVA